MNTFVALGLLLTVTDAIVLTRCEVANIFYNNGLNGYLGYELGHWMCVAFYESQYNTSARNVMESINDNLEATKFGMFQISNSKWCSDPDYPESPNVCEIQCEDLITDSGDYRVNIGCAATMVFFLGMKAWDSWIKNCNRTSFDDYYENCDIDFN
ncbi:lysozyme C-like isoform X1 [Chiloscyllium plagiosum]|uniref:lysozyme C-like isoform X1 n=1 Tax=Chiloscyllium plagiosum TaxID=36176 RepID=UPI001CB8143A|nr:lysozyme C-like isoform X1 [Chiloscyllium plagiosum]XP_043557553.1 lysozyme C-like isoform X1 [Chiloscyllium plagiosum]XP_043557554.1 lysozyme C-like isoform X1 [Chiloscyllium plagiosum]XP_043557555.1 lysozyme C-like isoform X1 [Chiloscyllium plagiosum]